MASCQVRFVWCSCCGRLELKAPFLRCSKCKTTFYCSKECQKAHWLPKASVSKTENLGHKFSCGKGLQLSDWEHLSQELAFAELRYNQNNIASDFARIQFVLMIGGWKASVPHSMSGPLISQNASLCLGKFRGRHPTTEPYQIPSYEAGIREQQTCMGTLQPGQQWQSMLWGILCAVDAGLVAVSHERDSLIIHVIGVRSYTDGMIDWCAFRKWLQAFVWPKLSQLTIVLCGLFSGESNSIEGQTAWNNICASRDPALEIIISPGPWHELFDSSAQLDMAILLEPGFQTWFQTWYETLRALQSTRCRRVEGISNVMQRVPVIISGQSLWDSATSANDSGDVTLYEKFLEDIGFEISVPKQTNPFSAFWHFSKQPQPVLHNRYLCRNGFLLVATGKTDCQPLAASEVHARACISKAELSLSMEEWYQNCTPRGPFLVQAWQKLLQDLQQRNFHFPVNTNPDEITAAAERLAIDMQRKNLLMDGEISTTDLNIMD